jgi:hypothetical protein
MKPSDVTRTLKEIHAILSLINQTGGKDGAGTNLETFVEEEAK